MSLEQPEGNSLDPNGNVYFGAGQFRYFEPVETVQEEDGTFSVTFNNIPRSSYTTYELQRSFDGEENWTPLFTPGLEADPFGVVSYHDPMPQVAAFYRLLVITDTQRTFTIRNTGAGTVTGLAITVLGEDSGHFELNTVGTADSLDPGATTTFAITYVAQDSTPRSAELRIATQSGEFFTVNLIGADMPFPSSKPLLANVTLVPAGPDTPAGIAGQVVNGPAQGEVSLEASTDLGREDQWEVIAVISLDGNGSATFGQTILVTDPSSTGFASNFYRLRTD